MEFIRYQIEQLNGWIDHKKIVGELDKTNKALMVIEDELFQRNLTGDGEDLARFPLKLVSNLVYLGEVVSTGDFKPTDQQLKRYEELKKQVTTNDKQLQKALEKIKKQINPMLQKAGIPILLLDAPDSPICSLFEAGAAF